MCGAWFWLISLVMFLFIYKFFYNKVFNIKAKLGSLENVGWCMNKNPWETQLWVPICGSPLLHKSVYNTPTQQSFCLLSCRWRKLSSWWKKYHLGDLKLLSFIFLRPWRMVLSSPAAYSIRAMCFSYSISCFCREAEFSVKISKSGRLPPSSGVNRGCKSLKWVVSQVGSLWRECEPLSTAIGGSGKEQQPGISQPVHQQSDEWWSEVALQDLWKSQLLPRETVVSQFV